MMAHAVNPLRFSSFDELDRIKNEWNEVYRKSGCESHYLTLEFIRLWYTSFASPEQIRIYRIVDNDEAIGFLPLVLKVCRGIRTLSSLTNYHCMHSGPLVLKMRETVFQTRVLSDLYQGLPEWDVLNLEYSYDFDRFPWLFVPEILISKKYQWKCHSEPTYTIKLNQSFQAYFARLSTNSKKHYKKTVNKFYRDASWSVQHYHGTDALAQWQTFLELENSGWKGEGGSSLKKISENYQLFYRGMIAQLAKSGALWISLLWYEGIPIAGNFMYREADILHVFKAGYDENSFSKSPSNILCTEMVRFLSEFPDGLNTINFFPGDFGYKHKLLHQEYECHTTLLYRRTLRGRFLYRYNQLKTMIKTFIGREKRRAILYGDRI